MNSDLLTSRDISWTKEKKKTELSEDVSKKAHRYLDQG